MVLADDPAGFVDRQLLDFLPERDLYLNDLKVPVPDDVPNTESILRVMKCIIIQATCLCWRLLLDPVHAD